LAQREDDEARSPKAKAGGTQEEIVAQHEDEEEEEKMLKMNTSLEGKAGLNLQKQKAIKHKLRFEITTNLQVAGRRRYWLRIMMMMMPALPRRKQTAS